MAQTNPEDLGLVDIDKSYNLPDSDQSAALTQFILGNETMVNKFIAAMLGQLYDENKNEIYSLNKKVIPRRVMNDFGITKYSGFLSQITDKGVLHSNLKKDDVCELAYQTLIDVLCDVFVNSESYGLDISDFDLFLAQLKLIVFTTLKRPQDAGERKAINRREKVIEHIMRREGSDMVKEPQAFHKLGRGGRQ